MFEGDHGFRVPEPKGTPGKSWQHEMCSTDNDAVSGDGEATKEAGRSCRSRCSRARTLVGVPPPLAALERRPCHRPPTRAARSASTGSTRPREGVRFEATEQSEPPQHGLPTGGSRPPWSSPAADSSAVPAPSSLRPCVCCSGCCCRCCCGAQQSGGVRLTASHELRQLSQCIRGGCLLANSAM